MAERNLDFDKITERRGTNCLKYDFAVKRGKPADVLPLWVADMDFPTSSYVQDALIRQAEHGIFGYSEGTESYFEAVQGWMKRHHDWQVKEDWLVKTPGIVMALALVVKAYTEPGDGGRGFQRINVACPRAVLEEALTKLERAVAAWRLEVSRNEN